MINIQNPLDETQSLVFEKEEQLNDWLCTNFNKAVNDVAEASSKKAVLVKALDAQCKDDKPSGTVKVNGEFYQASIVRSTTPKYATLDKSQDSKIQILYTVVEEAREFIKVSFDERQAGMQEWLDQCSNDNFKDLTEEEVKAIKEFIACRRLEPATPQIKVKQLKEISTVDVNI